MSGRFACPGGSRVWYMRRDVGGAGRRRRGPRHGRVRRSVGRGTASRLSAEPTRMLRGMLLRRALVAAGCVTGVTLVAAAELTLRALDIGSPARVFAPAVDAQGRRVMRAAWNPQWGTNVPPDPQREFLADKPAGTYRIFVVGESSAEGSPYGPGLAFSGWLALRLAAEAPEVHWEVVNAAFAGAQSWSQLAVVQDIARHEPDLLVVYLGHNEVGTRFSAADRRRLDPRYWLRGWLTQLRLYRVLSSLLPAGTPDVLDLRRVSRPGETFAVLPPGSTRHYATGADRALSTRLYRANVEDMVRT